LCPLASYIYAPIMHIPLQSSLKFMNYANVSRQNVKEMNKFDKKVWEIVNKFIYLHSELKE